MHLDLPLQIKINCIDKKKPIDPELTQRCSIKE
jgi:hypothetical protein